MEGLTEGRVVHFVMPKTRCFSEGQHRPAIIVNAWNKEAPQEVALANLIVFLDGSNDGPHKPVEPLATGARYIPEGHTMWATSIHYSETEEIGTWHWPERA